MILDKFSKSMTHLDTIKIYGANALAFLSTFTTIDIILKITALVASIAYTVVKTWVLIRNEIRKDDDKD